MGPKCYDTWNLNARFWGARRHASLARLVTCIGIWLLSCTGVFSQLALENRASEHVVLRGQGTAEAQDLGEAPEIATDRQATNGLANEMQDQINALRKQMGGGVASQLKDLFDDRENGRQQLQQDFNQHLNRLVDQASPATVAPPSPEPPSVQSCQLLGSVEENCKTLRDAARQLDEVSADLEEIKMYCEADQIRASARNLRLQARMLAPRRAVRAFPGHTPSASRVRYGDQEVLPKNLRLPTIAPDSKIRPPR